MNDKNIVNILLEEPQTNKYNNAVVYKLIDRDNNNIYIGSTINLKSRLEGHRKDKKRYPNKKLHKNINVYNVDVIILENVNCNTKEELRKIEDNYIKDALLNNPSCCNTYRAILTAEELKECKIRSIKSYNAINRELINNKRRNYYYKHREVIIQKQKEYAEIHTVHIKEYCKKYHKTYAKVNKEKIKQKRAELTTCTCGCTMQKYDINKHLNTNKHKKLMLQVNTQK